MMILSKGFNTRSGSFSWPEILSQRELNLIVPSLPFFLQMNLQLFTITLPKKEKYLNVFHLFLPFETWFNSHQELSILALIDIHPFLTILPPFYESSIQYPDFVNQ